MMNVAATRAKEEFYVIGDKELYLSLGSEVANNTMMIIRKYAKDHPDLVDNDVSCSTAAANAAPPVRRITGKVTGVNTNPMTNKKYAYVKGNDGEKYTVTEQIFSETPDADDIICKGKTISFISAANQAGTVRYARDIRQYSS